jgi:hypothetical protein
MRYRITVWRNSGVFREAGRAFVYSAMAFALVFLVVAGTDEGGVAWPLRGARCAPLAPLASLFGAALTAMRARNCGELRAAMALGMDPRSRMVAWSLGAFVLSAIVAIMVATGLSVAGFFPVGTQPQAFRWSDGTYTSASLGGRVTSSGILEAFPPEGPPTSMLLGASQAAATITLLLGIALPLLGSIATAKTVKPIAFVIFAGVCSTIFLLQLAAARHIAALTAAGPSLMISGLAMFALFLEGRERKGHKSP